jgi:hypothetical protein
VGLEFDRTTAGLDVIWEPARSHTWATTDTAMALPSGASISPGGKTVDNRFRFNNLTVAAGLERTAKWLDLQVGLRLKRIRYRLEQELFLSEQGSQVRKSWLEWGPSWSADTAFGPVELRYSGRFVARGFPPPGWFPREVINSGTDLIVGVAESVGHSQYHMTTHRLSLSMPLGR